MFKAPAIITSLRTMIGDQTIRMTADFQELTPEAETTLFASRNKFGTLAFSESDIDLKELELPDVEFKGDKSKAKRLRDVLYVYFTKKGGKSEDFDAYYNKYYEKRIQNIKDKINEL